MKRISYAPGPRHWKALSIFEIADSKSQNQRLAHPWIWICKTQLSWFDQGIIQNKLIHWPRLSCAFSLTCLVCMLTSLLWQQQEFLLTGFCAPALSHKEWRVFCSDQSQKQLYNRFLMAEAPQTQQRKTTITESPWGSSPSSMLLGLAHSYFPSRNFGELSLRSQDINTWGSPPSDLAQFNMCLREPGSK